MAKVYGVALAGAGMVSAAHAEAIGELPETELKIVYSRSEERARPFAAKYGVPWTTDYQAALAHPGVDIVDITTPPWRHADMAIAAATAGKHLVLEKPLAVTLGECRSILDACARHDVKLTVTFQNRCKKVMRRLHEYCHGGGLGDLLYGSAHVKWFRPQAYYDGDDWRGRRETEGGGVVFGQAGHYLDLLMWLFGPARRVYASLAVTPVHRNIDIENLGVVNIVFRNGALGTLEAATCLYPGLPERLEVHGRRGTIIIEGSRLKTWAIKDPGPGDEPGDVSEPTGSGASDPMAFPIAWHKACIEDLCAAVRENRAPWIDGREGMRLNEICHYVYESARRGAPVDIPEAG